MLFCEDDVVAVHESAEKNEKPNTYGWEIWKRFGVRFICEKRKIMIINRSEDERHTN